MTIKSLRVDGVIHELIQRHYRSMEAYIRSYIRDHGTTRLDIALDVGELEIASDDDRIFLRMAHADQYQINCHREVRIRQLLPARFRPALPG